jgi:hypothetical protein
MSEDGRKVAEAKEEANAARWAKTVRPPSCYASSLSSFDCHGSPTYHVTMGRAIGQPSSQASGHQAWDVSASL